MRRLFNLGLIALLLSGCPTRAPIPPGVVPEQQEVGDSEIEYGTKVFDLLRSRYPVSDDPQLNERVRKVTDKLTATGEASKYPWYIYVLEGNNVENAAATRGNYIFVWSGIFNKINDDDELAVVLSHEIAHVLSGHTRPTPEEEAHAMIGDVLGQVSENIIYQQGGWIGLAAGITGALLKLGYEAATVNPEQRRQELEADQVGLLLLAKSKIDPHAAIRFWERVANESWGVSDSLDFLVSHPSSEDRLIAIREQLPFALAVYRGEATTYPMTPVLGADLKIQQPNIELAEDRQWIVKSKAVVVFEAPSPRSTAVGTLKKDDLVTGVKNGEWVQASTPVAGFIQQKELELK
jgi:hypothetical protein